MDVLTEISASPHSPTSDFHAECLIRRCNILCMRKRYLYLLQISRSYCFLWMVRSYHILVHINQSFRNMIRCHSVAGVSWILLGPRSHTRILSPIGPYMMDILKCRYISYLIGTDVPTRDLPSYLTTQHNMPQDLGPLLGSLELGVIFSSILYGVLIVQLYNYLQLNFTDGLPVRALVRTTVFLMNFCKNCSNGPCGFPIMIAVCSRVRYCFHLWLPFG